MKKKPALKAQNGFFDLDLRLFRQKITRLLS